MELPRWGVFAFLDGLGGEDTIGFAREVERLGYGVLWLVEALGRDALAHAAALLVRTERLVVGSGVASIWGREASQAMAAARTNAEVSGGRFVLGLGVNNPTSAAMRGLPYDRPVTAMRTYLRRLGETPYGAPPPTEDPPVVVAALQPRMLEVAAAQAAGTLTYLMTPAHTARARAALGTRWVCVEQAVILETDPVRARAAARAYLGFYLPAIAIYTRTLATLGFDTADFAGGLSDRLVDALVAWGDAAQIRSRLEEHVRAGASHVCILPLDPAGGLVPDRRALAVLAPYLEH